MKRTFILILAAAAAVALFAVLVHGVLLAANVATPAATTVEGLTLRRLWATTAAGIALLGVAAGALALLRPDGRFGGRFGGLGSGLALAAGLIAAVNGALNLAVATGGPGTGNGVVGAAGALVLGLLAIALSAWPLPARARRHAASPDVGRNRVSQRNSVS